MLENVVVEEVAPRRIAAVRRSATNATLSDVILGSLDVVWPFLRSHNVRTGHNIVLYHDQAFEQLDVGVEVTGDLPAHDDIAVTETPSGRVATVAYFGPYEDLSLAHTAIARYCISNGIRVAGPSWEVYGDPSPDPLQTRTDVFYLLRD